MTPTSTLATVAGALETAAGAITSANPNQSGYWKRIAAAVETLAGSASTANSHEAGYRLRAAIALEAIAGTSGAEENRNEAGLLKRIVDALEVQAGAVGTGSLSNRLLTAAGSAAFADLDLIFTLSSINPLITFSRASTGTYFDSSGVMQTAAIDSPRLDYHPTTLLPRGILIEEARTNVCLRSAEFDNGAWLRDNGETVTANVSAAPDGTTSADRLTIDGSLASNRIYQVFNPALNATSTFSVWARVPSGTGKTYLSLLDGSWVASTVTACNLTTTWQRFSVTRALTGGIGYITIGNHSNGAGATDASNVIEIWGAQLEAGAFASSYIPTAGVAVTRSADVAQLTGANFSSWFNAAAGTFVAEGDSPASGTCPLFAADDNTAAEAIRGYTSAADPKFIVVDGGATQADIDAGAIVSQTPFKLAAAFAANDFAVSLGGAAVVTDVAGTLPTVDRLRIGADQAGNRLNGHLKRLRFFAERKANAVLQSLSA